MKQAPFSMLSIPEIPPKPRRRGLLAISDKIIPIRAMEDLLEIAGSLIDTAKISDHVGLIARHSKEWIQKKIQLYHSQDVNVVVGGIPFELAVLQGKVVEYFKSVKDTGFDGIEISDDVIEPLSVEDRNELIQKAKNYGLKVYTEIGRKNLDIPFNAEYFGALIQKDIRNGVEKVYIERSEIKHLMDTDPSELDRLLDIVGKESVIFEIGPDQTIQRTVWLLNRYGSELNLASIMPDMVIAVDALRRGMHRGIGYNFLYQKQDPK